MRSEQILESNPAERAKRPRKEGHVVRDVWTADQLRSFLDSVRVHRLFAFFWLAAYTGARRGELLNLRWSDVIWHSPTLRIRGSVSVVNGERVEGTSKSGRGRVISLDHDTVAVLRAHRERQRADQERAAGSWVAGDHVFRMEIGSPL